MIPVWKFFLWAFLLNAVAFGAVLSVAFAVGYQEAFRGVLFGGLIGTANLVTLVFITWRLVGERGQHKWAYGLALVLKFFFLGGALYLAVRLINLDVVWFAIGLTVPVGTLIVSAIFRLWRWQGVFFV